MVDTRGAPAARYMAVSIWERIVEEQASWLFLLMDTSGGASVLAVFFIGGH